MAIIEVPTRVDISSYKYKLTLEETVYTFTYTYNKRIERWHMSIGDADDNTLLGDIVLLTNVDLIGRFKSDELPPGTLICFDTKGENVSPTRDDLGNRIKLLYQESE